MDVAAYLKELLSQNKRIFVPGLGAFYIQKTAVDYDQQQFFPPENSVKFTADAQADDELISYISAQKNISPQASGYFLEKFVDQLKLTAQTKNIPVKEVLFAADDQAHAFFNQENFGLPAIGLSALKTAQPVAETPAASESETLPQQDYVENFYREFSGNLPAEEIRPQKNTGFWIALILLLAVCCLGIYALYLYEPNVFKSFLAKKQPEVTVVRPPVADNLARAPKAIQPEMQKDTTANVAADTPVTSVKTLAPPPQKTEIEAVKTASDMVAKSPYEIIGASFKTLKGAKTFLLQLQARGMRNAKILNNTAGKQVLITFGSYQDKGEALNALEKIRIKDSHSEAYIQHYLK